MLEPRHAIVLLVLGAATPAAQAYELGPEGEPLSVEVHAFASQGFILTTNNNNYLDNGTTGGSFQFSEIGVNFTKSLTDRLRLGLQLFAQDLGPAGNYTVQMDWFYVDYRLTDWLGIRFGRVKIPFGLYNEVNDVDSARLSVLLPQSVYPIENSNYLLAQTGGELYGYLRLGSAGAIDYHAYAGTIFAEAVTSPGSFVQITSLTTPYVVGGRVLWETPVEGLRVGASVQTLKLDFNLLAGATPLTADIPAALWVASAEYAAHNLLLAAEYSRWYLRSYSSDPAIFPEVTHNAVSERGYVMAAYRVTRWLQAGAYYSLLYPDITQRTGSENMQLDGAATIRFDINSHLLVKLEGHYMTGTAVLDPTLNNNTPLNALAPHWAVFLLKTTGYF
jgi:hypothetical protein